MNIIYSVTVKPDADIQLEYLDWLKEEHCHEVVGTGCFDHFKILKVLEEQEIDGPSYNIQYSTDSIQRYFDYIHQHADGMRQKGKHKFGEKFVAFRTLLKEV
jgi:hypothetical protein